jgi:hypothetical protein
MPNLVPKVSVVLSALAACAAGFSPSRAQACGGLFCATSSPVNQAAEQIVFVDHPGDTVTAIIQIMYEGPAHEFAWVLPVPGVPDVGVSSDHALEAIKQATNPTYMLQTTAMSCGGTTNNSLGGRSFSGADADGADRPGVSVAASGAVGPYDYHVIAFDAQLQHPEDAAIEWLTGNGYDVGDLGPELLRPYLEERLNLIAFKLTKGNDAGSIRPVILTYESVLPSIPIRPTAVAANDDMGVMVWVLGENRAVPQNYKSLELNEALLDWFNPMRNYNEVVIRAANEAMGHGFVTEYAGRHAELGLAVFPEWQRAEWQAFSLRDYDSPLAMVQEASEYYSTWDGFDDALREAVMLSPQVSFEDFRSCMRCYVDQQQAAIDMAVFRAELFRLVIKPVQETQRLLDSQPYMTRLYTTLSASEMTLDPVFAQNRDLGDYSNIHTAQQILGCDGETWRVELPQGDVVRGFQAGVWPVQGSDGPAALKILQLGTEGRGRVVEDNTAVVERMIASRNRATTAQAREAGLSFDDNGGCSAAGRVPAGTASWLLLAVCALMHRRRR